MKRWLHYARPYARYFVIGPLCMIVEVLGEILLPSLYGSIVNVGIAEQNVWYIAGVCGLMILTAVLMMTGGVGGAYFASKASVNYAADLRRDVYSKIQKFSFANIDRFSTGSLVTRLTNDVTQIMNMINMLMRMCLRAPGMLIGALIMTIAMNPSLAVVLAVSIPLLAVIIVTVVRTGFPRFTRMQAKMDGLNNKIQEDLTNVRVIKSFVREDFEKERFAQANGDLKSTTMRALSVVIMMMPAMMLVMNFTILAVIWFGGQQVIGGTMAVVVACYPKLAKSFPKHIKIMLRAKAFNPTIYVEQLTELAQIARKNGLLALEEKANEQEDPFFKQAIMLIVDANDPDRVRSILENDIEQTSARHQEVVAMYERGSNAAPAFGMIGTLIGLINMLKNLDGADMNSLGPSMSVALVTTFYGSVLAHVLFNPIAANLTARDEEEILCRQIIVEGIMAIQSGENPKFLRERLMTFMNQKQREEGGSGGGEGEPAQKGRKKRKK